MFDPKQSRGSSLRTVKARVYTESLRIYGNLHLHPRGDAAKLLNGARAYVSLSSCRVYTKGDHPPAATDLRAEPDFLVIPKDSILWLSTQDKPPVQPQQRRNLYVLYPDSEHILKGEFSAPANVRLSDFMARSFSERGFHMLYQAELRLSKGGDVVRAEAVERFSHLTLNLRKVAGVFDLAESADKMTFSGFS